jgi:hypothetical protein
VIIKRQPFYKESTYVQIYAKQHQEYEIVHVKPYQMIVYVSLTRSRKGERDRGFEEAAASWLPAILDTGLNDNLCINARHLLGWTGLALSDFPVKRTGEKTTHGPADRREASIWLHYNSGRKSGFDPRGNAKIQRPFAPEYRPHHLNCHNILVFPSPPSNHPEDIVPRLPTLGVRALAESKLNVDIRLKSEPIHFSIFQ